MREYTDSISLEAESAARRGLALAREMGFASADPYDGLSSPLAGILRSKLLRQIWLQTIKRSGESSRRLFGVKPVRMAKTLALFALAAKQLGDDDLAESLVDELLRLGAESPWGYEFDVQTRWAYYPKGTPNVVATTFSLRAIDAVGRISEVSPHVGLWLAGLYDRRGYFYYTDTSDKLVHNGSLLAAESLARLGLHEELVEKAVSTSRRLQRGAGGWPYGEAPELGWEDSFHTVYVIDSLSELRRRGFDIGDSVERALPYWKSEFFTEEGKPKYYSTDKFSSREIHNNATVLGALADYDHHAGLGDLIAPVLASLLTAQNVDGGFRSSPRGPLFLRWNQGHAVLALSKVARRDADE